MRISRNILSVVFVVILVSACSAVFSEKAQDSKESVSVCTGNVDCVKTNIPVNGALILGDINAAKKVIVFTDPECIFCARLHLEMKKVLERRKDIVFYLKLYPLEFHKDAYWKAKSIVCNKSIKMLEDNFDREPIPRTECNTTEIDDNIALAGKLGINGTPTLILYDGRRNDGLLSADILIEFIDGREPFK